MKIFLAGASGVLGRQLIPLLTDRGHQVVGMTRTSAKTTLIRELGAEPVLADGLDVTAVGAAVRAAEPEVVVHQMTALATIDMRHIDRSFATTNKLRTVGTDVLLAAAREVGARRFVAQSFAGWPYARTGGPVKTEDDPLDPNPPDGYRETLDAIKYLEATVTGSAAPAGVVLRYGGFYGPDTSVSADGEIVREVRKRRLPVVGGGAGVWSFVHTQDAAAATVAAIEQAKPGLYNIVDDHPAPSSAWLPALAEAAGAKPPMRVPAWIGRLAAGSAATTIMTEGRGASNAKARKELEWAPRYPSWREGFRTLFA
ncbi:MAG TPA: NAD-dependent epimerase/dehydratase family protein [Actinomycetes bacterium]|nr:NAD-dependent epimerase/dehydratase family protein [Actinomycetes bacterium]